MGGVTSPDSIESLTISMPATASVIPPAQIGSRRPNRSSKPMLSFHDRDSGSGSSLEGAGSIGSLTRSAGRRSA
jgi:hypothetical protein